MQLNERPSSNSTGTTRGLPRRRKRSRSSSKSGGKTTGAREAAIYCRVSTKEQTENYSLATQERACRDYCRRHGYAVAAVFVEEGESAKTADRTEFQKLLKFCRSNEGRVRYVVELDNDLKADRTRLGMKAALSAGKWPFLTPLGYRRRDDGDGRSVIEPDPERAPLVRRAFESYATGLRKQRELLRELTALGLRTTGGAAVSLQTFENVLRNPFYCGALSVRGWDDIEPQRGDFEALISEELFEQVQRVLDGRTPRAVPHDRSNPDFPLRSFVRCGCCGAALTGSWSRGRAKRYPYYRCPKSCDGGNVRKEVLEDAFLKHLDSQSPKPELLKLFRRIVLDVWRQKNADVVTTQQQIRRKLDQLTAKKDNVVEASRAARRTRGLTGLEPPKAQSFSGCCAVFRAENQRW